MTGSSHSIETPAFLKEEEEKKEPVKVI